MSKTTAPGKGLQLMCLEGEAYSFSCHHWCMRRSLGCVQYRKRKIFRGGNIFAIFAGTITP